MRAFLATTLLIGLLLGACTSSDEPATEPEPTQPGVVEDPAAPTSEAETDELFPDVVEAQLTSQSDGSFTVSATLSSPYDSPQRYADAWRVLDPDGNELGVRELAHDHAGEQPFTRSLGAVEIPAGVTEVTIQGRDQVSGWGGATVTVAVDR